MLEDAGSSFGEPVIVRGVSNVKHVEVIS